MHDAAKVLIVDDNANIHGILDKLFKLRVGDGNSPLIFHADNDQSALEIVTNNPDIDVIIRRLEWLRISNSGQSGSALSAYSSLCIQSQQEQFL